MANSLTDFNNLYRFNQFLKYEQAEPPIKKKRRRKTSKISGILFYSTLVIAVLVALLFSATNKAGAPRNFLGFSGMTVLTGSMQSEIPQGSLIINKRVEPNTLEVGDDITFIRVDGTTVTHRIVIIYENYNESGRRGFKTKGIENKIADNEIVSADNVIGKVIFCNLTLGKTLSFIKGNLLACILIGAMFLGLLAALHMVISTYKIDKPNPKRQRKSRKQPIAG